MRIWPKVIISDLEEGLIKPSIYSNSNLSILKIRFLKVLIKVWNIRF